MLYVLSISGAVWSLDFMPLIAFSISSIDGADKLTRCTLWTRSGAKLPESGVSGEIVNSLLKCSCYRRSYSQHVFQLIVVLFRRGVWYRWFLQHFRLRLICLNTQRNKLVESFESIPDWTIVCGIERNHNEMFQKGFCFHVSAWVLSLYDKSILKLVYY